MNEALRRTWPVVLVTIVALLYLWVAVAAHGWDRVLGLAGGLAILAAVALGRRYFAAAVAVLVLGALPLAVITWWSIATPVLAILALVLGAMAIRNVNHTSMLAR